MSINLSIREKLPTNSVIFDDESFDNSIIGLTFDGSVIYLFEKMVEEYAMDNGCELEEAIAWIEYNTLRALPYFPEPKPVIVFEGMV